MNRPFQVILPLAVLLSTAPSSLGQDPLQQFLGDGSANASVTPGDPSTSSFSSSFPTWVLPDDGSLPGSTSGSASFTGDGINAVGSASASYAVSSGWSGISVSSTASANYPAIPPNPPGLDNAASGQGHAQGRFFIHDLIFSGPSDGPIQGSLNLLFSGNAEASAVGTRPGNLTQGFSYFLGNLAGAAQLYGETYGHILAEVFGEGGGTLEGGGILAGYAGGTVEMTTDQWEIPIGVPLRLYLELGGDSLVGGGYGFSGEAASEANLWLPHNTPLFNLPEGFTVNSANGAIVNNYYTPIPEPEHYFALAGAGLALFGLYRRTRRRGSA